MKKLLSKTEAAFSHVLFLHFFGNWKILKALSYKKKTDEEYCLATTSYKTQYTKKYNLFITRK